MDSDEAKPVMGEGSRGGVRKRPMLVDTLIAIDPSIVKLGYAVFERRGSYPTKSLERKLGILHWGPWGLATYGTIRGKKGFKRNWERRVSFMVAELVKKVQPGPMDTFVIEMPSIWGGDAGRGAASRNSSAIIKLVALVFSIRQWVECMLSGRKPKGGRSRRSPSRVFLVKVAKWKGQLPKEITQARVYRRFKVDISDGGGIDHNTIDAIGLGAWWIDKRESPSKDADEV